MDPQLKRHLRFTAYYANMSSVNSYGKPTWGTATSFTCRYEPYTSEIIEVNRAGMSEGGGRGSTQELVNTTHRIFTETAITMDDRIWLPGDDQTDATKARRPLRIAPIVNAETGLTEHYEVHV